jgi:hypothetical protein
MRVEPPPRPSVATDNNEQVSNQHAKPKYTKKQRPTASTIPNLWKIVTKNANATYGYNGDSNE